MQRQSGRWNFFRHVCDDLNMPRALASLWILHDTEVDAKIKRECVRRADAVLGLDLLSNAERHIEVITDMRGVKIKLDAGTQLPDTVRSSLIALLQRRAAAVPEKIFLLRIGFVTALPRLGCGVA